MGAVLAKFAMAAVLADWHRRSVVHLSVIAVVAWSAVHAYTGAIFVVLGVFVAMLIDPLVRGDRRLSLRNAAVIGLAVLLLQLPLIVFQLTKPHGAAMGAVTDGLSRALSGERAPEMKEPQWLYEAVRSSSSCRDVCLARMAAADLRQYRRALPERSGAPVGRSS
jgi:hypothetical protein